MSAILSQMIAAALDGPDDLAEECMKYMRAVAAAPPLPQLPQLPSLPPLPSPALDPSSAISKLAALREAILQGALQAPRPPVLLAPATYQPTDREREVAALVATIVERHQSRASRIDEDAGPAINWIMVGERSHPSDAYRALDPRDRIKPWSTERGGQGQQQHVLDLASIRRLAKSIVRAHRPRANLLLDEQHGLVIRVKGPLDQKSIIHSWAPSGIIGELLPVLDPTDPLLRSSPCDLHYRVDQSETWTTATTFDAGACLLVQSTDGRPWIMARREHPYIMLRAFWLRDVLARLPNGPIELASSWYVMVRSPLMVFPGVGRVRSIPSSLRRDLVQWSGIWTAASNYARPFLISQCMDTRDPAELNEIFPAPRQLAA
ncbi:MAG: hypothetical protein FJ254_09830 [Phycisphaerae bacterium]|nr:hypothetical protein [Phycisphaerae bacterium]